MWQEMQIVGKFWKVSGGWKGGSKSGSMDCYEQSKIPISQFKVNKNLLEVFNGQN
jgi:hypothetical protein